MRQKTKKIFRSSVSALALTLGLSVLLPGIGVDAKVGEKKDVFGMEYGSVGMGSSYAAGFISLNSKEQSSSLSVNYKRVVDGPLISQTHPQLKIFNKGGKLKFEIRDISTSRIDINPGTMTNNNIDIADYIEWPTIYSNSFSKVRFLDLDKELWKYKQPGVGSLNASDSNHRTVYVGNGNFRVESKGTRFSNESNIVFPGFNSKKGAFQLYSNNMIVLGKSAYVAAERDFKLSVMRNGKSIYTADVKKGKTIANVISGIQGVQFKKNDIVEMKHNQRTITYRFDGNTFKHVQPSSQKPAVMKVKDIAITRGTPLTDEIMLRDITATGGNGGNITKRVEVLSPGKNGIDTNKVGHYTRSYEVADDNGSIATASRKIRVVDPPVITATNIGIAKGTPVTDEVMLRGVTAKDGKGVDITKKIKVTAPGKDNVDSSKIATYPQGYEVTDEYGIKVTAERNITVAEPPVITVEDITVTKGTLLTDELMLRGVTARDGKGADITAKIQVIAPGKDGVDTNAVGTYTPSYEVIDTNGIKVTAARKIKVIAVEGQSTISAEDITIGKGTPLTDEVMLRGVTARDANGEDLTARIVPVAPGKDGIDTNTVGVHAASYEVTDDKGVKVSVTRKINVTPVVGKLTIKASNLSIGTFMPLTDEVMLRGVTAVDANGVDFTHRVQPMRADSLIMDRMGTYERYYEAADDQGVYVRESRMIKVVHLNGPFTINAPDMNIKAGTIPTDEILLTGITATDAYGVDATYRVTVAPGQQPIGVSSPGSSYTRAYVATDDLGRKTFISRNIHIIR